jgi:hypothetical protein
MAKPLTRNSSTGERPSRQARRARANDERFFSRPRTFRRGIMLVNFTDQGLKDVKDVPNNEA